MSGHRSTALSKNISARFWEWLTGILRPSAIMEWAAEHFEGDSRNMAGMFLPAAAGLHVAIF